MDQIKALPGVKSMATRPTSIGNQSPALPRTACLVFLNATNETLLDRTQQIMRHFPQPDYGEHEQPDESIWI